MAQIIKNRRGSLERISAVSSSFQKGELIITSGSSNLTTTNGSSILFAATESGSVQAVNRFLMGTNAPNIFSSSVYNGLVKGVPYYASGSSTLYLLGSDKNDIPDLTGNISNFSASVATSINALSASIGGGSIGNSVTLLSSKTGSYATTGSNTFEGLQHINGAIEIHSGSNPELRLQNTTTGIEYHIQNGDSGNFQIHNGTTDKLLFRFLSASAAEGNQDAFFYGDLVVSESISAHTIFAQQITASVFSGSINGIGNVTAFSTSVDSRLSNLQLTSASINTSVAALNTSSASQQTSIDALNSYTSSNTSTTALNSFTASAETRFTEIGVVSGSLIASASTAKTTNDTQDVRLTNIESFSGSQLTQNTALATITGSLIGSASAASIAIANLNANSGSYALLSGSNVFYGTQTITGSLYVAYDLIVQGSSSVQYITASQVDLGTNVIVLNNDSPAVRFGGISVVDSGSANGASGSLLWDSLDNNWIYQHPSGGAESGMSAILISGPLNSGSLGNEAHITPGKIMVATGDDHIGDSIITQAADNSNVQITGGVGVTGSLNIKDSAATFSIVGNGFSETYLQSNGGMLLQAGGGGVQIKSNSLAVDNNLTVGGDISGSTINGLGNATAYSQSVSASFASVIANVGSGVGVSITNLNSFSSSQLTQNSTLATYTGSVETRLTEVGVVSGSLITSASAAKTTNDSQDVSITNINSTTASLNTSVTALNSSSASQQTSIDALNVVSSSNLIRLTNLESTSASVNTSITNINSFSSSVLTRLTEIGVVSGSLIVSASAAKTTNDTQDGRLNNLETKSSSIDISVAALNSFTSSNASTTALNAFTGSANERFTEIGVVSGSLIASASAAKTTNDTQDGRLTNIESFSASVNTSVAALNTSSASQQISIDALNVVSGSNLIRLTNLESTSASLNTSVSNLNTTSASLNTSVSNLNTTTASLNTSVAALNTSSASQQISIDALNSYTSSNTSTTALNAFTASAENRFTEIGVVSGSLISSASAASIANANQNTFTQSANVRLNNLESTSASVNTSLFNINSFTESADVRLDNLEAKSASVDTSVFNINSFSSSTLVSLSNLQSKSASVDTSIFNINGTTASLNTSVAALNTYSSSLKTAFELTGSNVVVLGDFTVRGTTTSVESNTIQLGDNIIELNGTGAANGGLLVKDPTAPNTVSGSLLWDSTNDYWKAGAAGAESKVALMGGDNLVTSSAQLLFDQITGYSTYSSSVATSFSASNASITSLSASVSSVTGEFSSSVATSFSASVASQTLLSSSFASSQATQNGRLDNLETTSGSLNSFSSSINTTIKTKLNAENVVSGSSQIDITSTTGYSTFSGSIATSISASVAGATWDNLVGKPAGIVSGSIQVDITATTGFSTFSSSIETRISLIDGGTY